MLMLIFLMLILMLLNLNTGYADAYTDLCIKIMFLCCKHRTGQGQIPCWKEKPKGGGGAKRGGGMVNW